MSARNKTEFQADLFYLFWRNIKVLLPANYSSGTQDFGPHQRKNTKATETKYLVFPTVVKKARLFKGSAGLRCIFSTIGKFRIAQDQQLSSIQFDMLKNLLPSMTNSWNPMPETKFLLWFFSLCVTSSECFHHFSIVAIYKYYYFPFPKILH